MAFKRVKGTNDFYPEDMIVRNKIFDSLRKSAESFNFKEVSAPALETMNLLKCKSGEEVEKQIFVLEKRGKGSIGLRFELTASLVRMFIERQKMLPKPVKWYSLSRMWRYERPQKGREREFYQLSVELFGSDSFIADAEVISLMIKCLTDLGLTKKDFVVKISNRKLIQGLFMEFIDEKNIEKVFTEIDKISKISRGELEANLRDLSLDDDQIEQVYHIILTEDIKTLEPKNKTAKEGLNELNSLLERLDMNFVEVDLSTVRGLAYYTGTVFEIFDRQAKLRSIGGGGRYDDMVRLFGGEQCPATGFGIGCSTLTLLLKERGLLPEPDIACDYFIATVGEDVIQEAQKIASKLRTRFNVDMDITGRKLGKQLSYANSIGAKNVIIIGEDELKKGVLKVKDFTTGSEKSTTVDKIMKK